MGEWTHVFLMEINNSPIKSNTWVLFTSVKLAQDTIDFKAYTGSHSFPDGLDRSWHSLGAIHSLVRQLHRFRCKAVLEQWQLISPSWRGSEQFVGLPKRTNSTLNVLTAFVSTAHRKLIPFIYHSVTELRCGYQARVILHQLCSFSPASGEWDL